MFERTYYFRNHIRWSFGLGNPNYAGAFIATLIPWIWGLQRKTAGRSIFATYGLIMAELYLYFGLIHTYSRGAFFSLLSARVMICVLGRSYRFRCYSRTCFAKDCAVGLLLLVTGFWERIAPTYLVSDGSVTHRLDLWKAALEMAATSPITGWGTNSAGSAFVNWYQPLERTELYTTMVNSYLDIAVCSGLIVAFLVLAGIASFTLVPVVRSSGCVFIFSSKAVLAAWFTANCFTTLWRQPFLWISPILAILCACYTAMCKPNRTAFIRRLAVCVACSGAVCIVAFILGSDRRGRQKTQVLKTRSGITVLCERSDASVLYYVWADKRVFGEYPGRAFRELCASVDHCAFSFEPTPTDIERSGSIRKHFILSGRCFPLLTKAITAGDCDILLIHPFGDVGLRGELQQLRRANVSVKAVLPEVDELNANGQWRQLLAELGATVAVSKGVGIDVRPTWPGIMEGKL